MHELAGVLSSDALSRNNTRFSAGALFRGLAKLWNTGIPSLVSHDSHRPVGWSVPTAVSFLSGCTRLHGVVLIPESGEEQTQLENTYQRHLAGRIQTATEPYMGKLRELLQEHLEGSEQPHECGATMLVGPSLARRFAPDLFALEDKDGLIPAEELKQLQPGVYQRGELVVFAHTYLRRTLSRWNNLNAPLLQELADVRSEPGVSVRVRLDSDAVGLASSVTTPIELAYWYGPKFSDDLASIPRGVARHEASDRERYFHGISRAEFWWQSRDGQHIFEAEELRDVPTLGAGANSFGCRYVHSIVEEESGRITHLDGAIREYTEEHLVSRLDSSIAEAGRHTQYTKLWRVDGSLPFSKWKLLIHHHFRDNPLVAEYLDPLAAEEPRAQGAPPPPPKKPAQRSVNDLVPIVLRPGDPVGLLLSVHHVPQEPLTVPRVVTPLMDVVRGSERQLVVEADTFEIRKLLRRRGEELSIPAVTRLAFEDRYHSFPLIIHDAPASVGATVDAFLELFGYWKNAGSDRVAALALGAVDGAREVRLSLIGHIVDLIPQLTRARALFSLLNNDEGIAGWADDAAAALVDPGPGNVHRATVSFDDLMTPHQLFHLRRKQLTPGEATLQTRGDGTPTWVLRFHPEERELADAVQKRTIQPTFAWIIRESKCSKCAEAYDSCTCSKYVDAGVAQYCTDAEIAYGIWTDRPARPLPHEPAA